MTALFASPWKFCIPPIFSDNIKKFTNSRKIRNPRDRFNVTIAQEDEEKEDGDFLINGQKREWVLTRIIETDQVTLGSDEEQTHATTCRSNKVGNRRGLLTFNLNRPRETSSILIATGYNEDDRMLITFIWLSFCNSEFRSKNYLISWPRYGGFVQAKVPEKLIICHFPHLKEHVYMRITF